jgi:eukaryotic-like serine/threonine-protein kinase
VTPERFQVIERLYRAALAFDNTQRSAYLDKECGQDESLRHEVEALLSYARYGAGFMESPAIEEFVLTSQSCAQEVAGAPRLSVIGKRVGEYQIVARIGSGGMGDVFRAVRADNEYKQLVAIKLVSVRDESGAIVSRLRSERQILAILDHPNIARLLDGGTTEDGIPFFVMELIDGSPIDQYCLTHQLSVDDRLQLFLQVCSAVEYAHQRLIIHRDLKPANILVSADGVPKLLDFGIAKILSPETADHGLDPTVTMVAALTPAYASPEQIKGQPITTASDVYSLGVILYELLTGLHPYRASGMSFHDVARAICEQEVEKPSVVVRQEEVKPRDAADRAAILPSKSSKLSHELSGDLDTIVTTALRKEPERRYATVDRLANDLRRYLKHLPVEARDDTFFYRTSKFVARHRIGTIASLVATLCLAVAVGLIVREAHIARLERARAERRFNDVRKLANSLMFDIHDSIKDLAGSTPARKLLVSKALEYLDSLSADSSGDQQLQRELAIAYDKVGDVQGNPRNSNLGDTRGALQSFQKALSIRQKLVASDPSDHALQWDLFGSYNHIGWVLQEQGDLDGALTSLRKAAEIARNTASESRDPRECDLIAGVHWGIATILESKGDLSGALENYREAASIRKSAQNPTPKQAASLNTHLAADYQGIARSLASLGQIDDALRAQKEVTSLLERQLEADKENATLKKFLGDSQLFSGEGFEKEGDWNDAVHSYRNAESIYSSLSTADPENTWSRDWLGFAKVHLGDLFLRQGKPNTALVSYRQACAIFEGRLGRSSADADSEVVAALAESYEGMGRAYEDLLGQSTVSKESRARDWQTARTYYQKSVDRWESLDEHAVLNSKQWGMRKDLAKKGLERSQLALASPR